MPGLKIEILPQGGDDRGHSFTITPDTLRFLGDVRDIHLTTIVPGAVRGNHYHQRRKEALLVVHSSDWELLWEDADATAVKRQRFPGRGVVLVSIPPGCPHALRNCGGADMLVFGMSNGGYEPQETVRQMLG
jgi:dTDP-4-dehydrorhamnose 3,5-epimerase-like enzyme